MYDDEYSKCERFLQNPLVSIGEELVKFAFEQIWEVGSKKLESSSQGSMDFKENLHRKKEIGLPYTNLKQVFDTIQNNQRKKWDMINAQPISYDLARFMLDTNHSAVDEQARKDNESTC